MTYTDTNLINPDILSKGYTYSEYRDLLEELLTRQKTTGENHSEEMLHYSRMNLLRMDRLDKYAKLDPALENRLENLDRQLFWLVLTEGWCGDAAQNLPIINKMADTTPNIEMKLILRDENLDLMDQFLTDGSSRSIPKLICIDVHTNEILGTWGPRPGTVQEMAMDYRSMSELSSKEAAENLHKWYADDRNREIQKEFLALLEKWDD
ncbi:MAG: thioredoxin family protein [Balneolaceae bacterium]